jgi:hypothetical protein
MSSYLDQVKAASQASQQNKEAAREVERHEWARRLIPLTERLERLLEQIPVELQAQGLSLSELRKMLRGRYRGSAHPGELGAALRALKFERVRCWRSGNAGFNTVWKRPSP